MLLHIFSHCILCVVFSECMLKYFLLPLCIQLYMFPFVVRIFREQHIFSFSCSNINAVLVHFMYGPSYAPHETVYQKYPKKPKPYYIVERDRRTYCARTVGRLQYSCSNSAILRCGGWWATYPWVLVYCAVAQWAESYIVIYQTMYDF